MTSLFEALGAYEFARVGQIALTLFALFESVRYGKRTFGKVCESVTLMLAVLVLISGVDLLDNVFHDQPTTTIARVWVIFDAALSFMVLRFISEARKRERRPRLGGSTRAR